MINQLSIMMVIHAVYAIPTLEHSVNSLGLFNKKSYSCGDGKGPSTSIFHCEQTCGTGESVGHTNTKTWCCPAGYTATNKYQAGHGDGASHCFGYGNVDPTSCTCNDPTPKIIKITQVPGSKKQSYNAVDDAESSCCDYGDEKCGTTSHVSFTNTMSLSFTSTTTITVGMEVEEGAIIEGVKLTASVAETLMSGKTHTETVGTDDTVECTCGIDVCKTASSTVTLSMQIQETTIPVELTSQMCGQTTTTTGSFHSKSYVSGTSSCKIAHSDTSCP